MAEDTHDKTPGGAAAGLRWDTSALHRARCDLASASAARAGVVLSFGVRRDKGRSGPEIGIELEHRVTLDAAAAQRLRELLTRVIAEYEARARASK